jgi:hypothetical protein
VSGESQISLLTPGDEVEVIVSVGEDRRDIAENILGRTDGLSIGDHTFDPMIPLTAPVKELMSLKSYIVSGILVQFSVEERAMPRGWCRVLRFSPISFNRFSGPAMDWETRELLSEWRGAMTASQ